MKRAIAIRKDNPDLLERLNKEVQSRPCASQVESGEALDTRLVQIETYTADRFVPQSVHLRKKEARAFR